MEYLFYFASIATKLNNVENPEHEISSPETFKQFMPPSNEDSIFLPECTEQEVAEIISQSSDFLIRVTKKLSPILTPVLTAQFNSLMTDGIFPSCLKTGKITPIYKNDDEQLLENYRPVSTLPIFGKIFERIIQFLDYQWDITQKSIWISKMSFHITCS